MRLIEQLICTGCNKKPAELQEYVDAGYENDMTAEEYVLSEEGTLNPTNGHFLCTNCYIKAEMPALPWPNQWRAP